VKVFKNKFSQVVEKSFILVLWKQRNLEI